MNEQEKMKEIIQGQSLILENLNTSRSPIHFKNNFTEDRCRSMNRTKSPLEIGLISRYKEDNSSKIMKMPLIYPSSALNSSKNSPRMQNESELKNLPFVFTNRLSFLNAKRLPLKYYKDQPKIMKNFRIPKDVFVVKK